MKKIFFSQSSSSEKISLKNIIQDNNIESILGGMSENLCQEDLSESDAVLYVQPTIRDVGDIGVTNGVRF